MSGTKNGKPSQNKPEWQPIVEFFTSLSADGKYVICKTVITAIKPRAYFDKVLSGPIERANNPQATPPGSEAESTGG